MRSKTTFGGNSGYSGYSQSKRALCAKAEGRFPKTQFCQTYDIRPKDFTFLEKRDFITTCEWHHTSSFGNRTKFYELDEDICAALVALDPVKYNGMSDDIELINLKIEELSKKLRSQIEAEEYYMECTIRHLSQDGEDGEDGAINRYMKASVVEIKGNISKIEKVLEKINAHHRLF